MGCSFGCSVGVGLVASCVLRASIFSGVYVVLNIYTSIASSPLLLLVFGWPWFGAGIDGGCVWRMLNVAGVVSVGFHCRTAVSFGFLWSFLMVDHLVGSYYHMQWKFLDSLLFNMNVMSWLDDLTCVIMDCKVIGNYYCKVTGNYYEVLLGNAKQKIKYDSDTGITGWRVKIDYFKMRSSKRHFP